MRREQGYDPGPKRQTEGGERGGREGGGEQGALLAAVDKQFTTTARGEPSVVLQGISRERTRPGGCNDLGVIK